MENDTLPENWSWSTIKEIADPNSKAIVSGPFGSNIGSRFFVELGVPVIRGNNLTTDMTRFIDAGFVFVTEEKADELKNCDAIIDDLIFTAAGSLGQVGIIPKTAKYSRYIISNKQLRARVDKQKVDPLFAFYWLSSKEMVKYIQQRNTGSSVPLINLSVLRSLPIPLPPLPEQRAIAHILGTLDDKIELNRRMNETLEAMAQTIFKSWFVDVDPVRAKAEGRDTGLPEEIADLFPDSFENSELGEVPKGWEIGTLGDIADVIDCLHSKKPERIESGKPLLQLCNIRDDGLIDMEDTYFISENDYEKWISRIEASFGDCVITNVGRVGAVAQIPEDVKAALGRNMTAIRCNSQYQYPTYLIELLLSDYMKGEISLKTDNGTVMSALNVKNIPKLSLVLPPKKILQAFESTASTFRRKMEANHQQSLLLKTLRNSLLPKLMSGEIRVITDSTKY